MTELPNQRINAATSAATGASAADSANVGDTAGRRGDGWRRHMLESTASVRALIERTRRIAVLGIKTAETGAPAFYVPEYAQRAGFEIIPVPVYFPEVTSILGEPVHRRLVDVPGRIDMVNVFRRPRDLPAHLDDILAAAPAAVWLQLGIRDDAFAERLARAGIAVVQDRCLLVELRYLGR